MNYSLSTPVQNFGGEMECWGEGVALAVEDCSMATCVKVYMYDNFDNQIGYQTGCIKRCTMAT